MGNKTKITKTFLQCNDLSWNKDYVVIIDNIIHTDLI